MVNRNKKTKALVLLSGGLDSILAVKVLQKQEIEVTGISFASHFFNTDLAEKAAEKLKIKLKKIDFSQEHLCMVKKPIYGRGKAMNPCIDCHLLMLKKAKEIMEAEGFDFVATGEVLGERPMSQNKQALILLEKQSGLKGYLLRPLSAKLLEPTLAEKNNLVDREQLLDIKGRSRKQQFALAEENNIKDFPSPAGGCLLTDLEFGHRLKELFEHWSEAKGSDVELLKIGRHFWTKDDKIVVGRNKEENQRLKQMAQEGDILIEPEKIPGPTILIRSKNRISEESLIIAKELILKYSPKLRVGRNNIK